MSLPAYKAGDWVRIIPTLKAGGSYRMNCNAEMVDYCKRRSFVVQINHIATYSYPAYVMENLSDCAFTEDMIMHRTQHRAVVIDRTKTVVPTLCQLCSKKCAYYSYNMTHKNDKTVEPRCCEKLINWLVLAEKLGDKNFPMDGRIRKVVVLDNEYINTQTKEEFNRLMQALRELDQKWSFINGSSPTSPSNADIFDRFKKNTVVMLMHKTKRIRILDGKDFNEKVPYSKWITGA